MPKDKFVDSYICMFGSWINKFIVSLKVCKYTVSYWFLIYYFVPLKWAKCGYLCWDITDFIVLE